MSNRQIEAEKPAESPRRCPLCSKPVTPAHAPFCSAACRDRDLIAWLDGQYMFAGNRPEDAEDG